MIIVDEHAEARLLQMLETFKTGVDVPRCLHLRLAGRKPALAAEAVVSLVAQILTDKESEIYFCEDGDVFVLTQRILPSQARKLSALIGQSVDLHELVHGWRPVFLEVEKKENRIRLRNEIMQRQAETLKAEKLRQAIVNAPLDTNVTQSIAQRRARHSKPEVMVVEDDAFSRRLVQNALQGMCSVRAVSEGRHAIEIYADNAPHMLLLDIDLPDVSGHDLLRRILSIDPDAYVVMLSGNGDRSNVLQAIESGAKGFVGKPFSKEKLLQYIERCPSLQNQLAGGTL